MLRTGVPWSSGLTWWQLKFLFWTISILTHFWGERSVALFYSADFSLNLFLSSSPLASYRSFWFLSRADFRFLNV